MSLLRVVVRYCHTTMEECDNDFEGMEVRFQIREIVEKGGWVLYFSVGK